jgi:hypothetical protein
VSHQDVPLADTLMQYHHDFYDAQPQHPADDSQPLRRLSIRTSAAAGSHR